jgi:glycosyltransferase involved in cell wall biosynthesis
MRITTIPESLKILLKGQHKFMTQNGFEVIGVASNGKALYDIKRDECIDVFPVEMTRRISPIKDLISLIALYKLIKQLKPNIVHTHTPKAGIIGMLASWLANVPLRLHTVAGLPLMETKGIKKALLIFIEKMTYACATNVYPNSNILFDFIINEKYTSRHKLKVIANGSSNGIDISYFDTDKINTSDKEELKKNIDINEGDFVFIFIGRLVKDKGLYELIEAFVKIEASNKKLILVGDYERELDQLCFKTINNLNTNNSIISVGMQSDIRPYLSISNCLVHPSYREGFPNVVMQACSMGIPCIVSNINGCNEIIIEGYNGTLVPPKNIEILKNKMIKMMLDSDWRNKLKENARFSVVSRFDRKQFWNILLQEYQDLIHSKFDLVKETF